MKKYILIFLFLFLLFVPPFQLFWFGYTYFISSYFDTSVDISQNPRLADVPEDIEPIHIVSKHWDVLLKPLYRYTLTGRVLFLINTRNWSERLLSEALGNEYMPIDILIAWNGLATYDYAITSYHRGTQSERRASFRIDYAKIVKKEELKKEDIISGKTTLQLCPQGKIEDCWSHNHIIPANDHILVALKYLAKRGKDIKLEGYLVDIGRARLDKPEIVYPDLITSTIPGGSACELFYVDRVQIGSRLFQ